jgi:hypothetical protein
MRVNTEAKKRNIMPWREDLALAACVIGRLPGRIIAAMCSRAVIRSSLGRHSASCGRLAVVFRSSFLRISRVQPSWIGNLRRHCAWPADSG